MTTIAIIGAQWGDEGKGKITDYLASQMKAVVRFQGGHNAGHTIWVNGQKSVTHLLPSGVITPGVLSIIGQGVVVDPAQFKKEIETLRSQGLMISPENLKVSLNASVITSYHQLLDVARENKSQLKIGTTGKGIGPCYEDKISRRGIKIIDLFQPELLKNKLDRSLEEKKIILDHYGVSYPSSQEEWTRLLQLAEYLRPYADETYSLIKNIQAQGQGILFEGAQGLLLDIDFGTYPYVTSSNTVVTSVLTGAGPVYPKWRLGVLKAYTTRVGEGPFPTQLDPDKEQKLREYGHEFGSTTGRSRKCGWLDLPLLKYAVRVSQLNGLVLTKCDVLAMLGELKVCVAYEYENKIIKEAFPGINLYEAKPIYQELEALNEIHLCRENNLSSSLEKYRKFIEEQLECPVFMVSYGQERTQLFLDPRWKM